MLRAAPKAAPPETPRISGLANGLRNIAWKTTPATEIPAPTAKAIITLGIRTFQNTMDISPEGEGRKPVNPTRSKTIPHMSGIPMAYRPIVRAATSETIKTDIKITQMRCFTIPSQRFPVI